MTSREPLTEDETTRLPVDALGIRLLRQISGSKNTLGNFVGGLRANADIARQRQSFPGGAVVGSSSAPLGPQFELAISEAWHWLIANGLLTEIPMEKGWFVLSRLGNRLLNDVADPVAHVRAERRIALDLHPLIASRVRSQFLLGEYDAAVFIAMRTVEERVRKLAGATQSDLGVDLVKRAFTDGGPLRDRYMDKGEADALMALFWGAIGVFKNPASHRQVDYEDATEASEAVLLADLLLRILDRSEAGARRRRDAADER